MMLVVMVVHSTQQAMPHLALKEPCSNFTNNSAVYDKYGSGGAIYTSDTTMISFSGTCNFISNSATNQGGAIYAGTNTTLTFRGTIHFISNGHIGGRIDTLNSSTAYGGGVYLGLQSTISILPNTTVYWENNHATLGGAIYLCYGCYPFKLLPYAHTKRSVLLPTASEKSVK